MRRRTLLVGLVLLLAAPLVLVLRGFAREAIVVPLLRAIWIGQLLFNSVPRLPFWAVFIGISVLIAATSLYRRQKPVSRGHTVASVRPGHIQGLAWRMRRVGEGDYFRWGFSKYMQELILEVLAEHERTTPKEIRHRVREGRLAVPPEIQAYLQVAPKPTFSTRPGFFRALWDRLRPRVQTSPLVSDLGSVVQFLEDHLDV